MTATITRPARGLGAIVAVQLGLLVGGAVALALDPPAQGWAVLVCAVGYVVALLWVCHATGNGELFSLAAFLVLVSIFQVLPDWVLVEVVGTLGFPDLGGPRIDDAIPIAMAVMWVAPLFVAVALAGGRPGRSALLAAIVFFGTEVLAPTLGLWEPVGDTRQVLGVALYVVPAEAALGWATATAYAAVRQRSLPVQAAAALAVSTFYLGALVLAFFVIDVASWQLTT